MPMSAGWDPVVDDSSITRMVNMIFLFASLGLKGMGKYPSKINALPLIRSGSPVSRSVDVLKQNRLQQPSLSTGMDTELLG
mmetsp:Transcript_18030/g.20365  ORF Transcript_18030/g.20365 Transcript_18030/m.20365 type:complete len:81 (-) Transcript_18030:318-560(-)